MPRVIKTIDLQHALYAYWQQSAVGTVSASKAVHTVLTMLDNDDSDWEFDCDAPFSIANHPKSPVQDIGFMSNEEYETLIIKNL